MSRKDAAHWRVWRAEHREEYNAKQRERRANETPEKRAQRLAARRAVYANMTDAQRANEFARQTESRNRRREAIRAYKREYWLKNKARLGEYAKAWKERNYQRQLQYNRDRTARIAIESGRAYHPRTSLRIPEWVTCPAQARHLRQRAEAYKQSVTVSFSTAIQSGLTVGRFSA